MIRKLTIRGFKSIRSAEVPLGPFTALIGANASGKSNLLEGLRVLQGLALGHTVRDVFDGRHEEVTRKRWPGIRGGSRYACWMPSSFGAASSSVEFEVVFDVGESKLLWSVGLDPHKGVLCGESLRSADDSREKIYDTAPVEPPASSDPYITARVYKGKGGGGGKAPHHQFSPHVAILKQLEGDRAVTQANAELAVKAGEALSDLQFLDASPVLLRAYDRPGARRMGDRGELFASVVRLLSEDPATKDAYVSWLQNLTPTHVHDLHFFKTELGEVMFGVKENGLSEPVPALSLSDGTLRFAAIAAALFEPDPPGVLLVEEIENGVNATRLRLLAELLRQRSAKGRPQVLVTTHSPLLLAYLPEALYANIIWVWRDAADGSTRALPVTEVPHLQDVVKRTPLNELFAQGWLEAAL